MGTEIQCICPHWDPDTSLSSTRHTESPNAPAHYSHQPGLSSDKLLCQRLSSCSSATHCAKGRAKLSQTKAIRRGDVQHPVCQDLTAQKTKDPKASLGASVPSYVHRLYHFHEAIFRHTKAIKVTRRSKWGEQEVPLEAC